MKNQIVFYPHNTLREIATPVHNFDSSLLQLLADMKESMLEKNGVGIAAPQINKSLCCFLVHWEEEIHTFINPSIMSVSESMDRHEEGCLSIPGVFADVKRYTGVEISAQNAHGEKFSVSAEGFFARIIQHEYDHLQGVLFFDHLSNGTKRRLLRTYERIQEEIGSNK